MTTSPFTDTDYYDDEQFHQLDCRGVRLDGIEFYSCTFQELTFLEATLNRCKFIECLFENCDLSLAQLVDCRFRRPRFVRSKLVGLDWTQTDTLFEADFSECTLNYANLAGLDLRKSTFERCIAHEVDFVQADLSHSNCRHTDFTGSRFVNTNLTQADFTRATNYTIVPTANILKQTKFTLPEAVALLHGLDIILDEG